MLQHCFYIPVLIFRDQRIASLVNVIILIHAIGTKEDIITLFYPFHLLFRPKTEAIIVFEKQFSIRYRSVFFQYSDSTNKIRNGI